MSFKAKRDTSFITIIIVAVLIVIAAISIPVIFSYDSLSFYNVILLFLILLISVGIIVWTSFCIKYEFRNDYLYISGGVFRSRIPYNAITQVESLNLTIADLLAGYRILSSKDGLILSYKTGLFGVVKISPKEKPLFLSELKKRSPQAIFKNNHQTN